MIPRVILFFAFIAHAFGLLLFCKCFYFPGYSFLIKNNYLNYCRDFPHLLLLWLKKRVHSIKVAFVIFVRDVH